MGTQQDPFFAFRVPVDNQVGHRHRFAGRPDDVREIVEIRPVRPRFSKSVLQQLLLLFHPGEPLNRGPNAEIRWSSS